MDGSLNMFTFILLDSALLIGSTVVCHNRSKEKHLMCILLCQRKAEPCNIHTFTSLTGKWLSFFLCKINTLIYCLSPSINLFSHNAEIKMTPFQALILITPADAWMYVGCISCVLGLVHNTLNTLLNVALCIGVFIDLGKFHKEVRGTHI